MSKKFYWLKMDKDYLSSPRIKKLRKIAGGDTYTIIYLKMQLLSIENGGIIKCEGIEPTLEEELSLILNEDVENVKVTISFLLSQGLLSGNNDDTYLLPDAAERIGSESDSKERVRAYRERKKALAASVTCNASVTECNTEKDKEQETDKEKEQDKGRKRPRSRFVPPSVDEVREYCIERRNGIDPEAFVDYYKTRGWKCGPGKPMADWKAAVRTWEKRRKEDKRGPVSDPIPAGERTYKGFKARSVLDDLD